MAVESAQNVVAGMSRDPKQPAAEGSASEAVHMLERADECLLRCILRGLRVPQYAAADVVDQVLVFQNQIVECFQVSLYSRPEQYRLAPFGFVIGFHFRS